MHNNPFVNFYYGLEDWRLFGGKELDRVLHVGKVLRDATSSLRRKYPMFNENFRAYSAAFMGEPYIALHAGDIDSPDFYKDVLDLDVLPSRVWLSNKNVGVIETLLNKKEIPFTKKWFGFSEKLFKISKV